MALYTNIEDVKAIMEDSLIMDDTDIQKYIVTANTLLGSVLSGDTTMSTDLRTEIEKWYTAHLITVTRNRTSVKEEVGDAAITYADIYGKNLESSPYGQVVKQLDTTGLIANIGKKKASIYAIKSFD